MNNRLVLQLREKAYKKASARAISSPYEMKNSEFDTMFQEMFVELIVKECADYVACGEFGDAGLAEELKKHFGVE